MRVGSAKRIATNLLPHAVPCGELDVACVPPKTKKAAQSKTRGEKARAKRKKKAVARQRKRSRPRRGKRVDAGAERAEEEGEEEDAKEESSSESESESESEEEEEDDGHAAKVWVESLQAMLKDPRRRLGPLDRANVTLALANATKTASASGRRAALKAARVVGATCHSCAGRTLAKMSFAVSVLLFTVTFHANSAHNLTRSP